MTPDPRLARLLGGPETGWLLARARRRLERGQPLSGTVTHPRPSEAERNAVARLLGRPARSGGALTVRWEAVDDVVRRSGAHSAGLADAVAVLSGPILDRAAVAAAAQDAWNRALHPLSATRDRPELAAWTDELLRTGLVRRLAPSPEDAGPLVAELAIVLDALPAEGEPTGRFAERLLGDAHALDADRPLSTLVFSAARCLSGLSEGTGSAWRREVWAGVGLFSDALSTTVLTLGLVGDQASPTGRSLRQLGEAGEPAVLTLRQLQRDRSWLGGLAGVTVSVCENPVVVSVAADRLGAACRPLVCTAGQPGVAVMRLLRDLADAGALLRHHGDFDWGGLRIGNLLVSRLPVRPWRFDAEAYLSAVRSSARPLSGRPVDAAWDATLSTAMSAHRRAVEEERVVDQLVDDLAAGSR